MGAHAADCAAICCCPCAIFSILGIVFIDLPSALAKRSISYIKKRASVTEGTELHQEKHGCDARFTLTPAMSEKESSKGIKEHQAIHIFRFDTENLLKHFGVEQLGFGCLTQHIE
ncbi:hypothetical protein KP509_24G043900 [Ceratopteris richardii]|nr:hypothetical protein KP509_24G043900 [Ceratopteris richardii]